MLEITNICHEAQHIVEEYRRRRTKIHRIQERLYTHELTYLRSLSYWTMFVHSKEAQKHTHTHAHTHTYTQDGKCHVLHAAWPNLSCEDIDYCYVRQLSIKPDKRRVVKTCMSMHSLLTVNLHV